MDVMEIHRLACEYADARAAVTYAALREGDEVWDLRVAEHGAAYQRLLGALIAAGLDVQALVTS